MERYTCRVSESSSCTGRDLCTRKRDFDEGERLGSLIGWGFRVSGTLRRVSVGPSVTCRGLNPERVDGVEEVEVTRTG